MNVNMSHLSGYPMAYGQPANPMPYSSYYNPYGMPYPPQSQYPSPAMQQRPSSQVGGNVQQVNPMGNATNPPHASSQAYNLLQQFQTQHSNQGWSPASAMPSGTTGSINPSMYQAQNVMPYGYQQNTAIPPPSPYAGNFAGIPNMSHQQQQQTGYGASRPPYKRF